MEISYKILENQQKISGITNLIFVRAAVEIDFFQMEYFHFIQYKALLHISISIAIEIWEELIEKQRQRDKTLIQREVDVIGVNIT